MRVLKNEYLAAALARAGAVGADLSGGCPGIADPTGYLGAYVARRVTTALLTAWSSAFRGAEVSADLPAPGEWVALWYGGRTGASVDVLTVLSPGEAGLLAVCEGSMRPEGFARVIANPRELAGFASAAEERTVLAALAAEMPPVAPGKRRRAVRAPARKIAAPVVPAAPVAALTRPNVRPGVADARRAGESPSLARRAASAPRKRTARLSPAAAIAAALTLRPSRGARARYVRGSGPGARR